MIAIEKTTFTMAIKPFLDDEMRKRGIYMHIKELTHNTTSKETRIRGLIPIWESKTIFFVGECGDLIENMRTFPRGQHDDVIDSLAMQLEVAYKPNNNSDFNDIMLADEPLFPQIGI